MDNLMIFRNGNTILPIKEVNGEIYFDAEQAAIGLGITQVKNSKVYVQWKRVNNYLNGVSAHVRKEGSSPLVEKGDYISEPDFYTLAIKANNPVAEKFQYWVTHDILPSIRKTGSYQAPAQKPMSQIELLEVQLGIIKKQEERLEDVEADVHELKENQKLEPGEYNYIGRLANRKVKEYIDVHHLTLSQEQRAKLYKDINSGIAEVAGVRTRTQLRAKDFNLVCDYINDWVPSVASLTLIKQMQSVSN